jgi:type VII secretion protein EccE
MTTRVTAATRTMTRGGGWILPIGVGQVVVWQLALLGTFAFPAGAQGAAAITAAMLVIGLTSVRAGGLHAQQWAMVYARYRLRRPVIDPAAATPIRALLPRLHVHTHVDRAGNRFGIASIDENLDYSVTLRLAPLTRPNPATLISLLRNAFDRPDLPLHAASLVAWTAPANPAPVTVHWLALRYRRDESPLPAQARGGGADGGRRTVANSALRLSAELSAAGHANTVLDTPELHKDLLVALGSGPVARRITESWREWSVGGLRQACFLPRRAIDALPLIGRHAPGSAFTCVAYTIGRGDTGTLHDTAAVRLSPATTQPRLTPKSVAARLDPRLTLANGRHGQHILATLPLALT